MVYRIPYTLRLLRRCPGLVLAAALLFTALIAANVAVFALASAALFHPVPCYRDSGRLVSLFSTRDGENRYPFTFAEYLDYATRTHTFSEVVPWVMRASNAVTPQGGARLAGAQVTSAFFEMSGVHAVLGRVLLRSDEQPGSPRAVAISTRLWKEYFHQDPKTPGRVLTLDGDQYIITGVLPRDFQLPEGVPDFLIPLPPAPERAVHNSANYLCLMARLKPGVTISQAHDDVNAIAARVKEEFPNANPEKTGVRVESLQQSMSAKIRSHILGLLGAVAILLLMAAVNMAGALVVRSWEWRRDFALLAAMGTDPALLRWQFLAQTIAIGLLSGIAGTALAGWRLSSLPGILPMWLPPLHPSILDPRVLLFALALSVVCGAILGMPAALHATRLPSNRSLVQAASSSRTLQGDSGRRLLVMAQVAACLVLVIGTGLLVRSLLRLEMVKPGFNPGNLLTFRLTPPLRYRETADGVALHDRILDRLTGAPVIAAGAASSLPLRRIGGLVDISEAGGARERILGVPYMFVGETYFAAMQIPLVNGRGFCFQDSANSHAVAVISQALANRLHAGDGIGAHLEIDDANGEPRDVEVIGVVRNVHQMRLGEENAETLYVPLRQLPPAASAFFGLGMYWVVRTQGDAMRAAPALRDRITLAAGDALVSDLIPMETFVQRELSEQRRYVWIAAGFAAAILILAAIGLHAVISHFVCRRSREIGVRMVLGACSREIVWHVIGEGLSLTITGAVFGLGAVFVLARLLSTMLFEVPVFDPLTLTCATLLLLTVTVLAATLPALRATRLDPIITLRQE